MGKSILSISGNEGGVGLLSYLRTRGFPISADCGGCGRCGKCAVEIVSGEFPYAMDPSRFAKPGETVPACRLECPRGGGKVAVSSPSAVTGIRCVTDASTYGGDDAEYAIAFDIGTTTIEAALSDLNAHVIVRRTSLLNPQRAFGADVISRIAGCVDNLDDMTAIVRSACAQTALALCAGICDVTSIRSVCFVGNPTMMHILRGVSPAGMGTYPFAMAYDGEIREPAAPYGLPNAEAVFPPASSAFVGSDITCGVISAGVDLEKTPALYVDAGTNGEIVLFSGSENGRTFAAASTAAGPALEGARIACGTGGVDGAICAIRRGSEHRTYLKTVGDRPPCGICGSGLIDIMAFLVDSGIVDRAGHLDGGRYVIPGGGGAYITQEDVREFQLAKSAIRAGIETLLDETGIGVESVGKVFLAGNLGMHMRIASAAATGMIPHGFENITSQCGNGALNGAVAYVTDRSFRERVLESTAMYRTIGLNDSHFFETKFIERMDFTTTR